MKNFAVTVGFLIVVLIAGAAIYIPLISPPPESVSYLDYVYRRGFSETGAPNLVSSIYLAYRAFDTLGETIVFMVSVSGVIHLIGRG
jgi:multicomponent Na+:H+ antiporter subunit B